MSVNLHPQFDSRFQQLNDTLESTASVIQYAKKILAMNTNPPPSNVHSKHKLDHAPSEQLNIRVEDIDNKKKYNSNASLNRKEQTQELKPKAFFAESEKGIKQVFSFGKLESALEGSVSSPHEDNRMLKSQVIRVFDTLQEFDKRSSGMRKSKQPLLRSSILNSQDSMLESIRIESNLMRDSYHSDRMFTTPPKKRSPEEQQIMRIQQRLYSKHDYQTDTKKLTASTILPAKFSPQLNSRSSPIKQYQFIQKSPKFHKKDEDIYALEGRFEQLRKRFKTELSNTAYVHKNQISFWELDRSPFKTSRSRTPKRDQYDSYPLKRKLSSHKTENSDCCGHSIHNETGRKVQCQRYRREIERDIRSKFLNQFGFLYTEKRVTYEELFQIYKQCRSKNIPQYRWSHQIYERLAPRRKNQPYKI